MKRSQHQVPAQLSTSAQVGPLLTMGAAHEMFPSSWALAVRPKILAVDGVGPRCVFEAQHWRTSSTKFIGDREKHDSELFGIKPTTLMSITMMNYVQGTDFKVKNFSR